MEQPITEQEWTRYQGEVNAARRGLQDFHLRPLDEAIAAYRDEVTVTHQQLVDHDVDVVRRFVGRLIGRICAKEELFKWAWAKINRGVNSGFAEWYKLQLAEAQLGSISQ
jgi:hypothetical protein